MTPSRRCVVVLSGGMDSAALAWLLREQRYELDCLTFDYGQRHRREIDHARMLAAQLGAPHRVADLRPLGWMWGDNALTGGADVPDGHYTDASMQATVVPNRNAMFLVVAYGAAAATGAEAVAIGVHGGDHPVYADCRPEFMSAFAAMEELALEGNRPVLLTPFVDLDKTQIARIGTRLGVPWELTWSCYRGGEAHCGTCGTCVERREAFALAGVPDPTRYAAPAPPPPTPERLR